MSLGIRGKLFALAVLLITVVDLTVGLYLERELRESLEVGVRVELTRHAKVAGALLEGMQQTPSAKTVDPIADRVGDATGTRVTIFTADGATLGDSELAVTELEMQADEIDSTELKAAISEGTGTSTHWSDAADASVMFVTVQVPGPSGPLLARASRPLRRIDAVVGRLRIVVVVAGLVGVVVAGIMVVLVASQVARTLEPVVHRVAEAVAVAPPPTDEERSLLSLQRMADDLETTMQTLSAERNRFEAVLQTMDQAVLATDPDQRVTTANRAARSLLSIAEGVEGRTLVEAVRVPGLIRLAEEATDTEPRHAEFEIGGGRRVEGRATRLTGGGVVLVLLDVTEIRRLERVRRDFVANVSHELRTPISVIKANAETLLSGALEDTVRGRQFVDAVMRHADRLGRIVADLLDISRIEAGRYPLEIASPRLSDVVASVIETVQVEAHSKSIDVQSSIAHDVVLEADRKALEHILINLVSNAVKYTGNDGHVEVGASATEDGIRVEVQDDGPGIDPKHRPRIFERFYRADPGRSRDMGGTGLGLSIVKHLVEAMEGQVGLDPRSPHGSVFWFTLKGSVADREQAPEPVATAVDETAEEPSEPPSSDA